MHRFVQQEHPDYPSSVAVAQMIEGGEMQLGIAQPPTPNELAINELTYELHNLLDTDKIAALVDLKRYVSTTPVAPGSPLVHPPLLNGILKWDEMLAQEMEALPPAGKDIAELVRTKARSRAEFMGKDNTYDRIFTIWQYDAGFDCCPFLTLYGLVVWANRTRARYMRLAISEDKAPAMPYGDMKSVLLAHQRGVHISSSENGTQAYYARDDTYIATIDAAALTNILSDDMRCMASLDAQRILRWEIFAGHERRHMHDGRLISITGGWEALARAASVSGANAGSRVHDIVERQASMSFKLPGKIERNASLLSFYEQAAMGQHPSFVQISLGPILMPGRMYDMEADAYTQQRDYYKDRKLVPILPVPPLVGRKTDWGAQCALSSWIAVEMRMSAIEIAQRGSVHIPLDTLQRLAALVSLPQKLLPAIMERWLSPTPAEPAYLQQPEPQRFVLGTALRRAWRHLKEAGKQELEARQNGKLAVAMKAKVRRKKLS